MDIRKLWLAVVPIITFAINTLWDIVSGYVATGEVKLDDFTDPVKLKAIALRALGATILATILQYRPKPHVQELTEAGNPKMVPSKRRGEAAHPSPPTKLI